MKDDDEPMTQSVAVEGVEGRVGAYERLMHPGEMPGDTGNEPTDDSYPPDGEDLDIARRGRNKPRTNSTQMLAFERSRRAMELRKVGVKYEDIAAQLGYASASGAYMAVRRAMKSNVDELTHELRSLNYNRLNEMLARVYPLALGGERMVRQPDGTMLQQSFPPSLDAMKEVRAILSQIESLMGAGTGQTVTVKGQVNHTGVVSHEHDVADGVIVVDFDTDGWQAALRRATNAGLAEGNDGSETAKFEVKPPSGYMAPALQEITTGEDDIIDAEIVEEKMVDPRAAIKMD